MFPELWQVEFGKDCVCVCVKKTMFKLLKKIYVSTITAEQLQLFINLESHNS